MNAELSLFKIADVLQMPISYDGKVLSGERFAEWTSQIGLKLPMQLSATAIFFSEQVGVVAHVIGELYVMVSHNPSKSGLSLYLIDAGKLEEEITELVSPKMNLREVVEYLGDAIVKAFYHSSGKWKPLAMPK